MFYPQILKMELKTTLSIIHLDFTGACTSVMTGLTTARMSHGIATIYWYVTGWPLIYSSVCVTVQIGTLLTNLGTEMNIRSSKSFYRNRRFLMSIFHYFHN